MPVYFIRSESIQNNRIVLTGDLVHHLRDVLRCEAGEIIELVDEKQARYRTELTQVTKEKIIATILRKDVKPASPGPSIFLAQAVLKGEKMDWVIQKATELGASAVLPVVTERTIARPRAERAAHQRERWRKIAKEAAQQCGRFDIPEIRPVVTLDELLTAPPETSLKLVPWEEEHGRSLKSALRNLKEEKTLMILIGPEGGFSPQEIEKARKAGWISVSLGPRILRAETAGMAVLAILEYERNNTR